jgi:hypothetical protein
MTMQRVVDFRELFAVDERTICSMLPFGFDVQSCVYGRFPCQENSARPFSACLL